MSPFTLHILTTALLLTGAIGVKADRTAQQSFLIHVPSRVSITASPARANAILPPGDTQVRCVPQVWKVSVNSSSGATVQITTMHSFHHVSDSNLRRDARLDLEILSQSQGGTWSASRSMAVTHHASGDEAVCVQVSSVNPGTAVLGLTVTFLQGDSLSTPKGDYETTVIGMITAH